MQVGDGACRDTRRIVFGSQTGDSLPRKSFLFPISRLLKSKSLRYQHYYPRSGCTGMQRLSMNEG
jgi:hypothetical protein